MKPIRTLSSSTQLLADYLAQGGDPSDWDRFRNNDRDAYLELRNALAERQHWLCGYCESSLQNPDVQVEHVIPKNPQTGNPTLALDHTNLIACCTGVARGEKGRDNQSCGQAKGEINDPAFIDPRQLPALPGFFKVRLNDGKMTADETACAATSFSADRVNRTIEILGLNAMRLQRERMNRLDNLTEVIAEYSDDTDLQVFMESWARDELLPNRNGALPDFFTTRRSYFAFERLSEEILAEPPQAWI